MRNNRIWSVSVEETGVVEVGVERADRAWGETRISQRSLLFNAASTKRVAPSDSDLQASSSGGASRQTAELFLQR